MAVVGTQRMFIRGRGSVLAIMIGKIAACTLVVVLAHGISRFSTKLLRQRVRNSETGITIACPSGWEGRAAFSSQWASQFPGEGRLGGMATGAGAKGLVAHFTVYPLEFFQFGPWTRHLPAINDWTEHHWVTAITRYLKFCGAGGNQIRQTRLLDGHALDLTGPRESSHWGAAVFRVDEDELLLFDLLAPSEAEYQSFERTWRRMVKRIERTR